MSKKIVLFLILFLFTASICQALPRVVLETTRDAIIAKYLTGRQLDPVEGVWVFNMRDRTGELAIIRNTTGKFTDQYYVGILTVAKGFGKVGEAKIFLNKGESPKIFPGKYIVQGTLGVFGGEQRIGSDYILKDKDTLITTLRDDDDDETVKIEFIRVEKN